MKRHLGARCELALWVVVPFDKPCCRKKVPGRFEAGCRVPQAPQTMICWPWPVVEYSVRGNSRRIVPAVGGIAVSTSTFFYRGHCLQLQSGLDVLIRAASLDHFRLCWFHCQLLNLFQSRVDGFSLRLGIVASRSFRIPVSYMRG